MRQSAAKMRAIAAMYPAQSITQIAKSDDMQLYSLTDNVQTCRRAVIRAIRWAKTDAKRFALELRNRKLGQAGIAGAKAGRNLGRYFKASHLYKLHT